MEYSGDEIRRFHAFLVRAGIVVLPGRVNDLATGNIVWRKTFGTTEDLAPGPAFRLGTPNVGSPAISAGGLVFIGAAMDDYLRALGVATGEELWKGRLPAGGQATPMIYEWDGRQYVVIYAGGHARMGTRLGDSLVAFALPESARQTGKHL